MVVKSNKYLYVVIYYSCNNITYYMMYTICQHFKYIPNTSFGVLVYLLNGQDCLTFLQGIRGFLPSEDLPSPPPTPGQLIEVSITKVPTPKNVVATCDLEKLKSHVATEIPAGGLGGVLPGMCVNARVVQIVPGGLVVRYMEVMEGYIPLVHAVGVGGQVV